MTSSSIIILETGRDLPTDSWLFYDMARNMRMHPLILVLSFRPVTHVVVQLKH